MRTLKKGRIRPHTIRFKLTEEFYDDGQRHDEYSDEQISGGQRHEEVVGHILETSVPADGEADEDVADGRRRDEDDQRKRLPP